MHHLLVSPAQAHSFINCVWGWTNIENLSCNQVVTARTQKIMLFAMMRKISTGLTSMTELAMLKASIVPIQQFVQILLGFPSPVMTAQGGHHAKPYTTQVVT